MAGTITLLVLAVLFLGAARQCSVLLRGARQRHDTERVRLLAPLPWASLAAAVVAIVLAVVRAWS